MSKQTQKWYEFQAAANGKPARLVIEDGIGEWGQSASAFRSDFARLGKDEDIEVHIKSGGGSCFEGFEIANIIAGHAGKVTVTLGSICGSIATIIACAGSHVTAAKNTLYMIHEPTVYAGGDAKELRKMAGVLDKIRKNIVGAYMKKTGKTEDELLAMIAEETWFTAEEAKEAGFVDAVADEDANDEVLDNIDLSHYANTAKLLSLQIGAGETALTSAGNGGPLTLAGIKNSLKAKPTTQPNTNSNTMSVPNTQNPPAAPDAAVLADATNKAAKDAVNAFRARRNEVLAMVKQEKNRTGCDFTAEAEQFLEGDKPSHEFSAVILASDKKPATVVGSGIELIEPMDAYKGTPGFDFVNSPQFRALGEQIKRAGRRGQGQIQVQAEVAQFNNVQTSTATSGSGLTSIEKLPGVVELGLRPLTVEGLIAHGVTSNTTIRDIQEVTYTEAAAAVTETGTLPELTVTYTEVDFPVKDIGGYIKMSENLLTDYPAVASLINKRIPYQVDRAVEDQLINGSGSGANITGILNTSGIQTLAKGSNTASDLALKLQTLVRWQNMTSNAAQGGFEPTGYVIHPTDWEMFQLLKDANNQYLMRGPFTGSYGNGAPVKFYTLWGIPVAVSPVTAQGTIICGAWDMGAMQFDRAGLIIEMTNSDGSDFLARKVTIRGTRRLALAVYRPGSFVTGTGL